MALGLSVAMLAALGGCSGQRAEESPKVPDSAVEEDPFASGAIPIKIAHYFAESHPLNVALETVFKPMIEEQTQGRYVVEIYPNNILGSEKEYTEATRLGALEACIPSTLLSDQFPKLRIMSFPWIFDDVEVGSKVLNDEEVKKDILGPLERADLIGMGFTVNGVRALSNNIRPINTLADCKGLKIRMPELDHFVDNGKAMGFNVVTMSMSEVFTALQQGVIEGQENPPTTLLASGWYEVQPYLALTRHQISYDWIAFNREFFQGLPPEDQAVIRAACDATIQAELKLYIDNENKDIETLKEKGVQVTEPDRTEFVAAGEKVVQKYADSIPEFKEILALIREKEEVYQK